jgi:hypothetical protein
MDQGPRQVQIIGRQDASRRKGRGSYPTSLTRKDRQGTARNPSGMPSSRRWLFPGISWVRESLPLFSEKTALQELLVCWVQPSRSWFRGSGSTDTLEAKRKPIAAPAVVVQSPAASKLDSRDARLPRIAGLAAVSVRGSPRRGRGSRHGQDDRPGSDSASRTSRGRIGLVSKRAWI